MKIAVQIKPIEKYEVIIDGKNVGEFSKESSWEGMAKLRGAKGVIIINDDPSLFEDIFAGIIGKVGGEPRTVEVVKISPDLVPIGAKG